MENDLKLIIKMFFFRESEIDQTNLFLKICVNLQTLHYKQHISCVYCCMTGENCQQMKVVDTNLPSGYLVGWASKLTCSYIYWPLVTCQMKIVTQVFSFFHFMMILNLSTKFGETNLQLTPNSIIVISFE